MEWESQTGGMEADSHETVIATDPFEGSQTFDSQLRYALPGGGEGEEIGISVLILPCQVENST